MLLVLLLVPAAGPLQAQPQTEESPAEEEHSPYGTGVGFQILLTNNGFGLGGYYKHGLGQATSLLAELNIGAGKDGREVKFFRYPGRNTIPNKANYLLMMPVQVGVQRRLFRNAIEENFRPYFQLTGGPTVGWEYPYFRDCNGDRKYDPLTACTEGEFEQTYDAVSALPRGSLRLGFGSTIALGAHFGSSKKMAQGVRIGYTFTYFRESIQLLEPDLPEAERAFFGTPTISLTIGRLF